MPTCDDPFVGRILFHYMLIKTVFFVKLYLYNVFMGGRILIVLLRCNLIVFKNFEYMFKANNLFSCLMHQINPDQV